MKVTNKTAYATIGCDVQLSENDRLALGIELDKVTNWLDSVDVPETSTELYKAINKITAFISKFAIRPSETNVFTDSPEDFKKADETVDTDDEKIRNWLVGYFHQYKKDGMESYANGLKVDSIITWLEKQESKANETTTAVEPASTDDVITVRIADFKKVAKLTMIIHRTSEASIARIKDILNSAEVKCVPCISFRCINESKKEVVNELIDAGYQVVPNGINQSLRL